MRRNLKYILPSIQIAIAIGLIILGDSQDEKIQNSVQLGIVVYTAPAWHLCDAISGPLRPLWLSWRCLHSAGGALAFITPMIFIALLWFLAGLNISSWITKKQLIMPSSRKLRLFCNIFFLIFGTLCAFYAWSGTYEPGIVDWIKGGPLHFVELTPFELTTDFLATVCYLIWAVVLIVFFGRDFVKTCVPRIAKQISGTPQNTK